MNLKVKSCKVQLNGSLMTGDTYPVKQWIKEYLCGKWDAEHKGWIVDLGQVDQFMNCKYPAITVDNSTPTEVTHTHKTHNGLCPKCHTYCYGDCTANS